MSATVPMHETHALFSALKHRLSDGAVARENEPMARRTTLRVGGPADIYVEPASEQDLQQIVRFCAQTGMPFMMLGRGSNLLVRDGGIRGVVACLGSGFAGIELRGSSLLCGAGARLRAVSYEAKKFALTGFEFMEGIPGSIGGALRMNAGAMGSSVFELVESVRFMNPSGDIEERCASEIPFEYRNCTLFQTHFALSAVLNGRVAESGKIEQRMAECSEKRWSSQPAAPSAGCIFKNSSTVSAGRLIQELALKGRKVGGAMISEEHGNFIVNLERATASDVIELIGIVKEAARRQRGIDLRTEVQIVGEDL